MLRDDSGVSVMAWDRGWPEEKVAGFSPKGLAGVEWDGGAKADAVPTDGSLSVTAASVGGGAAGTLP